VPSARSLLISFVIGVALFVLFAFTLIGLVGEAVVLLAAVGLLLRGLCVAAALVRKTDAC
jgi:hypothetical protein